MFYVCMLSLSHVWLLAILWSIACQSPLSMEFSRQETWSRLPFLIPIFYTRDKFFSSYLLILFLLSLMEDNFLFIINLHLSRNILSLFLSLSLSLSLCLTHTHIHTVLSDPTCDLLSLKDKHHACYQEIVTLFCNLAYYSLTWIPKWLRGKESTANAGDSEDMVPPLGGEVSLQKEMATNSSILGWKTPWTEEPGRLQSMGLQRAGHNWAPTCIVLCLVTQSCLTLCNTKDCSPPGSSVLGDSLSKNTGVGFHALLQLSSQPRDRTQASLIAGGFFTFWATRKAQISRLSFAVWL